MATTARRGVRSRRDPSRSRVAGPQRQAGVEGVRRPVLDGELDRLAGSHVVAAVDARTASVEMRGASTETIRWLSEPSFSTTSTFARRLLQDAAAN